MGSHPSESWWPVNGTDGLPVMLISDTCVHSEEYVSPFSLPFSFGDQFKLYNLFQKLNQPSRLSEIFRVCPYSFGVGYEMSSVPLI